MTTDRKIAANRLNGRKSRGPRTAAGKARARHNALRHGLATISRANPAACIEIEKMAKAICGEDRTPALFEQALIIAEHQLVLQSVCAQRVAVIERLRDPTAVTLAKGDNRLALAKARSREIELAWGELEQLRAKLAKTGEPQPNATYDQTKPLLHYAANGPPDERDEVNAMSEAIPDLRRLDRYERRAWSGLKRAIRAWMEIKLNSIAARLRSQSSSADQHADDERQIP